MPTRAVHLSKVLTLAFMVFAMGLEAARPSNIGSESTKQAPLKKVADFSMPAPAVRFDYQSFDATQGRLYSAKLTPKEFGFFYTKKRAVAANIDVSNRIN